MELVDLGLGEVAQPALAWTTALVKNGHLEIIPAGHQLCSTLSKPILVVEISAGNSTSYIGQFLSPSQSTAVHFSSTLNGSEDYKGSIKIWFYFPHLISRVSQSP